MAARRTRIPAALLVALLAAACADATEASPPPTSQPTAVGSLVVAVADNTFMPEVVEVAVGDTVVWDLDSARRPHDVTFSEDPDRASGTLDSGTWSTSFDEPGTYPYQCTLHSGMTGQVVVTGG
jgi:plastocyanin